MKTRYYYSPKMERFLLRSGFASGDTYVKTEVLINGEWKRFNERVSREGAEPLANYDDLKLVAEGIDLETRIVN